MHTEDRPKEESTIEDEPFMVIYNYRHNITHPSKPRFPRPLKLTPPPLHSIILTRKMAAEIELKNQADTKEPLVMREYAEIKNEKN